MLLTCAITIIINLSKQSWNEDDELNLNNAKTRCGMIYRDAPCLKKFVKIEEGNYKAICGKNK